MAMCRACGERWAQGHDGLCRRCWRDGVKDRRAEIREREMADLDRWLAHGDPEPTPPTQREPIRTVVVEGYVMDVMWDGSR